MKSTTEVKARLDKLEGTLVLAHKGLTELRGLRIEHARHTGNPDAFSDPIGFFREKGRWPEPSDW